MKKFDIEDYELFLEICKSVPDNRNAVTYAEKEIERLQELEKEKFIQYEQFVNQSVGKCYIQKNSNDSYSLFKITEATIKRVTMRGFNVKTEVLTLSKYSDNYSATYNHSYEDVLWINEIHEIDQEFYDKILSLSLKECMRAYKDTEFIYKEIIKEKGVK